MDQRKILGNRGEDIAADFLIARGYQVLEKNWRRGNMGELDLIVRKGREIRVIEVKARGAADGGHPEDAVTESKLARIADLTEIFLTIHQLAGDVHIDVIAITFRHGAAPEIEWLKDV